MVGSISSANDDNCSAVLVAALAASRHQNTDTSNTPSSRPRRNKLAVRIKRYHGVAKWIWNANDDVCGICQASFEGTAPGVKVRSVVYFTSAGSSLGCVEFSDRTTRARDNSTFFSHQPIHPFIYLFICFDIQYPGEDCPVVWGRCGHAFHLQCVSKWLTQASSKNSCPICRQEWEFGQNPTASNDDATTTTATSATTATATTNSDTATTATASAANSGAAGAAPAGAPVGGRNYEDDDL